MRISEIQVQTWNLKYLLSFDVLNYTKVNLISKILKPLQAMAHYYILILGMRTELVDHVKETLDKVVYDEENIMVMYIIVFLIVAFCCVVLTVV